MQIWLINSIILVATIAISTICTNKLLVYGDNEQPSIDCESEMDCSLLGDCDKDTHKCICDPGWTGDHCEKAHLLPASKNKGFADPTLPSWGGDVIYADGEYHMFAEYMESRCHVNEYGTNSGVLHAVSSEPDGPYKFKNFVLAPFHHGATIRKHPDGHYILFADGQDAPASTIKQCLATPVSLNVKSYLDVATKNVNLQTLYNRGTAPHDYLIVASSKNISAGLGEWNTQIIMKSDTNAPDWNCNRTNPSPMVFSNGTVLLALRTTSCDMTKKIEEINGDIGNPSKRINQCQHITIAESKNGWQGPYAQRGKSYIVGNEDPVFWKGKRGYFMLLHSKEACGVNGGIVETCGVIAYSRDTYQWRVGKIPAYSWHVQWDDGTTEKLIYRRRPKILFAEDGYTPLVLFNSAFRNENLGGPGHIQTLAVKFNLEPKGTKSPKSNDNTESDKISIHEKVEFDLSKEQNRDSASTLSSTERNLLAPTKYPTKYPTKSLTNSPDKPNFLIIMLDDVGYGDVSSYNQPCQASYMCPNPKTPNIDRMGKEGIRFTNFYASGVICSPSRAGLMTGRYPVRANVLVRVFTPDNLGGLPNDEITMATWFQKHGYMTRMSGKWHLGHLPNYLPTSHGFEKWIGIPYSHDYCPCPKKLTNTDDSKCRNNLPWCPIYNDTVIVQQPVILEDSVDYYTDAAIDYMQEAINLKKPFLLYYACMHAHHPQFANPKNIGISSSLGGRDGAYGDSIVEMDEGVGKLMRYIEKMKIKDNTYVILNSDNGPSLTDRKFGGSAGSLRCGKGTTWEGGQKVPAFIWGGLIDQPGRVVDQVISNIDIFPTIAKLAGIPMPDDRIIDGKDFSEVILDAANGIAERRGEFFYYGFNAFLYAARIGKYKLHYYTSNWMKNPDSLCRLPGYKYGNQKSPILFNLDLDPSESSPIDSTSEEYASAVKVINAAVKKHNCMGQKDAACNATPKMKCSLWGGPTKDSNGQPRYDPRVGDAAWEPYGSICCSKNQVAVYPIETYEAQRVRAEINKNSQLNELEKKKISNFDRNWIIRVKTNAIKEPYCTDCSQASILNPAACQNLVCNPGTVELGCSGLSCVPKSSTDGKIICITDENSWDIPGCEEGPDTGRKYCPEGYFTCADESRKCTKNKSECDRFGGMLYGPYHCASLNQTLSVMHGDPIEYY